MPAQPQSARHHLVALGLSTAVTLTAVVLLIHRSLAAPGGVSDERYQQAELFCQVFERLAQEYVTEVDDWELLYRGLEGMVSSLDPYCRFYDPLATQRFDEVTSGEYAGVGMVMQTEAEPVTVLYPFPGSPADQAGLEPGDRIVKVDGVSVEGLSIDQAQKMIKGPPDSEVTLTVVKRDIGQAEVVRITRQSIAQPSVLGTQMLEGTDGIGYLHVSGFQKNTDQEFVKALKTLKQQGARALILDLRFNTGGLLDQAVLMANRFVKSGVIVSLEGRIEESNMVHRANPKNDLGLDWEIIILTDERTASAAEVLAGALQDHKKALLMGNRTYGKGVVQSVVTLRTGGDREVSVKYTTAQYVTPGGQRIERTVGQTEERRGGLAPDFPLPQKSDAEARKTVAFLNQLNYPAAQRQRILEQLGRDPMAPTDDEDIEQAVKVLQGETFRRSIPQSATANSNK